MNKLALRIVFTITLLLGFVFSSEAQLYEDMSHLLPVPGATDQSMDLKAHDIDKDGDMDIILANEFQANRILLNNLNSVFSPGQYPALNNVAHDSEDVILEDFNGDGLIDMIFCSEDDINIGRTNVHEYYLGTENGQFVKSGYQFLDSEANAVISADINNDNWPDVLFGTSENILCFINDGTGIFNLAETRFPNISRVTQDLLANDIDNDGDIDIIEGNENGNIAYVNDGAGFFIAKSLEFNVSNIETRKVSASDVDNDGDIDLFFSNVAFIPTKNRQNRLLINDGTGSFNDETDDRLPIDNDHTVDALFEDIDFDSDVDLILANVFGGKIKVLANDGNGFFSDITIGVFPKEYTIDALGLISADFNNDNLNDLYFCDRNTGTSQKDILLFRKNTSTANIDEQEVSFDIFPNPCSQYIILNFPEIEIDNIWIIDSLGKLVLYLSLELNASQQTIHIDLSELSDGSYSFIVNADEKIYTRPFIIFKE